MLRLRAFDWYLLTLLIGGAPAIAAAQPPSLEGDWNEDNPSLSNSIVTYEQQGSRVTAKGSFFYNGFRCEWVGTGRIDGNRLEHTVRYTRRPPDEAWKGADGRFVLTLSADGRTLTGTWHNNNGDSGAKRLTRRKSAHSDPGTAPASTYSVEGDWKDEDASLSNSIVTYEQQGSRVTVRGSFVLNGFRCEWVGTGRINGNRLEHTVNYTRRPPDEAWKGADGRFVLTLSADGRILAGTWHNNNGDSGAKRLTRRKSAQSDPGATALTYSVEGDWKDDNPSLSNSIVTYEQQGSRVTARGSFLYNGFRCEWVGTGRLNGNRLEHTVNYTRRPPDEAWKGADGRFVLTLSADGRILTGTWYNNNGDSGEKRLTR